LSESGPDHDKTFEVEVSAGANMKQSGRGKSKKDAQKQAAQKAWEILHREKKS
jgi:ribonuclease-3